MLILSRKVNESIVVDGRILIKVVRVEGEVVKLGIEAPLDVPVHRQEIYEEIKNSNKEAAKNGKDAVPRLPENRKKVANARNALVKIKTELKTEKITNNQQQTIGVKTYDHKH